jgi:hypothetical protein
MIITPEAASPLPLKGAALAAWQSQFRGACLARPTHCIMDS